MVMIRRLIGLVVALACAPLAYAHHGPGSFDLTKEVEFTGVLTRLDLVNPHSWIYFDVTDKDGRVTHHRCEMRAATVLRRSGWSADMFKSGQRVTIQAAPDKIDPLSCYLNTVLFENGTRMDRYGQYIKAPAGEIRAVKGPIVVPNTQRALRRPTGEPNIAGDWAPEQLVMTDPRGRGGALVPLSTVAQYEPGYRPARGGRGGARGTGPRTYGGTELTDLGEKAAAAFTQQDNPRFRCETTSVIFDWTFDGPVNRITQNKDTIVLQYGQLGFTRTIHMDQTKHPASIKPSRAGHSIGRWENDVLVVDTVGFAPGVLNPPVRNSDKLHVVERFSLDPKTMTLTRNYVAEDPVYLKGQYTGSDAIKVADAPFKPDPCKDTSFIDYSKQVEKRK